ncbi:MAG: tyrosine-type recombinase/integrase [Polyangia bacterium]|uniref:Putative integrase/recombinase y4rE n=1 Tax=Candidatus Sulfotelmatobacter kueseliae TaxID=2042962 RepID=A0A2U3KC41_9BACT|nr:putative integrase/recombinase y4rE [Candidatus Sulfotelmatobacter kueseliae]
MSTFARRLVDHINRYVELRRSLGYSFESQAATLQAFGRFVKRRSEAGPLTQHLALTFVLKCPVTPNARARRYGFLKNFADYFSIFDSRTEALDPQALPRSRAVPPARLLDEDELARLLEAARQISPLHPMRGFTLFTIIGLLASTGLRSGEVTHLDRGDVNLERGILRIRGTKFRKNRLVPVHPTTLQALRTYVNARDKAYPRSSSPAFFLSLRGGRWSKCGFGGTFRQACVKAGLDQGSHRGLRPHDLRHRFATIRLVTWYQEGVDVQARLPLLATYLGHTRYSDTAYYITGTPALLGLAASRAFQPEGGAR